jgi:hypothetical protein
MYHQREVTPEPKRRRKMRTKMAKRIWNGHLKSNLVLATMASLRL